MKKVFALLLVFILPLVALTACGGESNPVEAEDDVRWHPALIEYFDATEEQMEMISPAAAFPNDSMTKKGVTVNVLQTIGDNYGVYILLEVATPKDLAAVENLWYEKITVRISWSGAPQDLGCTVTLLEEGDGKLTYLLKGYRLVAPIQGGEVTLYLRNLGYWDDGFVTLLDGTWALAWDFPYESMSAAIDAPGPFSVNGVDVSGARIEISPISLYISAAMNSSPLGLSNPDIEVNFKDGSQIFIDGKMETEALRHTPDGADFIQEQIYHSFKAIIDVDDVESVTIGDITIPFETDSR